MMPQTWSTERLATHLIVPNTHDDKYRRGVLGLRTGSSAYPGAAVLSVEAAWRTGIGMLRYAPPLGDSVPRLGLPTPAAAVLAAQPETVFVHGPVPAESCDAWVLGSGSDPRQRSFAETELLRRFLASSTPVVVDAGALELLVAGRPTAPVIATPHRGEFLSLWRGLDFGTLPADWPEDRGVSPSIEALSDAAARLSDALGVVVLLKGSTTVVAAPSGLTHTVGPSTPWLATAGTGDVLAGIMGALVATHARGVSPRRDAHPSPAPAHEVHDALAELAASAATLHDLAARVAAGVSVQSNHPGRPITASDVAQALPTAIAQVLAEHR